jgi:4-amino-4-deoxy-L-arabinose transferase-like glycosyltransferase
MTTTPMPCSDGRKNLGATFAGLILGLILLATFLLKLRNLDHTALTRWDEVFHAVVAQNVLKHPLKPTLVDKPYLSYEPTKWHENHVWLHKPILPFWQVALSFAVLGINTFALRLPAAILSTLAAWLTYLIGKDLLDRPAALVAAALQAVSPFLLTLVQGYQFADNVDVALLFWVEVGFFFLMRALRTGSWRDIVLAGAAQGLAFLCKSYLGFILFGVALAAWLLPLCRLAKRDDCRIGPARLLGMLAATALVALPWVIFCRTNYPQEFLHEHAQVWRHLVTNVENWQAPWDLLVFNYLVAIHGVFYTLMLVAAAVLFGKAVAERHAGLWLLYAWGLGVILPHAFAVTKTPSATVLAIPPLVLLLGCLVSDACRGDRLALAALTGVLAMTFVFPAVIRPPGHGSQYGREFGAVMMRNLWVIGQVVGGIVVASVFLIASALLPAAGAGRLVRLAHGAALAFCLCALAWRGYGTVNAAWRVTSRNEADPAAVDVGQFARRHLPDNAVLLCDEQRGDEHVALMFYTGRTCYPLTSVDNVARRIVQAGGVPYVVAYRRMPLAAVHVSGRYGPTIYLWEP